MSASLNCWHASLNQALIYNYETASLISGCLCIDYRESLPQKCYCSWKQMQMYNSSGVMAIFLGSSPPPGLQDA